MMATQIPTTKRHPRSKLLFMEVAKAHPMKNPGQNDHPLLLFKSANRASIQNTIHRSSVLNSLEVKKYTGTSAEASEDHKPTRFE